MTNSEVRLIMDGIAHDARKTGRKDCQKKMRVFSRNPLSYPLYVNESEKKNQSRSRSINVILFINIDPLLL
jgi:hypothetical protein